jgi:hypothetical protein
METHGVPTNPKENRVFPKPVEAAPSPLETSRHATELKTDAHHKTVPKPENKNQDHLRPVSGQGSARRTIKRRSANSQCQNGRRTNAKEFLQRGSGDSPIWISREPQASIISTRLGMLFQDRFQQVVYLFLCESFCFFRGQSFDANLLEALARRACLFLNSFVK